MVESAPKKLEIYRFTSRRFHGFIMDSAFTYPRFSRRKNISQLRLLPQVSVRHCISDRGFAFEYYFRLDRTCLSRDEYTFAAQSATRNTDNNATGALRFPLALATS